MWLELHPRHSERSLTVRNSLGPGLSIEPSVDYTLLDWMYKGERTNGVRQNEIAMSFITHSQG
jgi:hypothetical protein